MTEDTSMWESMTKELLENLQALGVWPWGFCFCPPHHLDAIGRASMENAPEEDHCIECRDARRAIRAATVRLALAEEARS